MRNTFLSRFTPSMMPKEVLEDIFVQRERLAARTVRLVREGLLTGPPAHTLFVGPRGIGKTHLVSLIYHRLKADEELQGRLTVAWLPEDEGGIASFLDLLIATLQALGRDDPALGSWLAPRLEALYDSGAAEAEARALLVEAAGDHPLLLIAENLDDLFLGLKDAGQKALRSFLQETRSVTLVVTAQSLFGGVSHHAAPFYGFFRVEHLPGLSLTEAVDLLTRIARYEGKPDLAAFLQSTAGRARVRAVDHLVAGNPRLYVIFSEFLTRDSLDELVPPFLDMLDDLTPYYQAKMRALSPQQRKLVDFLSGALGALPVKQIARRTLIGAATAAVQLKALREGGYVRALPQGRETYYELKEPLMRLCLDVKKQRGGPINLFVEFLRLWCPPEELERRLAGLSGEEPFARAALREALRLSVTRENPLLAACRLDYERYTKQGDQERAAQALEERQALGGPTTLASPIQATQAKPSAVVQCLDNAKKLLTQHRYEEALLACEQCLVIDPGNTTAWHDKGVALLGLDQFEKSLIVWERSLVRDPKNAPVWFCKGLTLASLNRFDEALVAYERSLALDSQDAFVWYQKGLALFNLGRPEEELIAYQHCLDLDPKRVAALYNKGLALGKLDRHGEALGAWELCLDLDPQDANAWYNKGNALNRLGRDEEAVTAYEQCLTLDPSRADAWYGKGMAMFGLGRFSEELAAWEQCMALDLQDAAAWYNKGTALGRLGRDEEALAAYEQSLALAPHDADAWYSKGLVLFDLGRFEEALTDFDHALQTKSDQPKWYVDRASTLFALDHWNEGFAALHKALPLFQDAMEDLAEATVYLVHHVLTGDTGRWPVRVETFAATYATHDQALALGQALVRSIPGLRSTLFSVDARRLWLETWRDKTAGRSEFTLPLRLLDVAVRFLNSGEPPDPRILLELQAEERSLLRPFLGVAEEEEDEE